MIFMEYTDRADWWRANDQGQYATDPAKGWVLRQTNIGHTLGSAQEGANGFKVNGENKWYMFVDNYGSVASGARYGYNLLEADNLDSENPWSVLKADDYFLTANTKHGGVVSLTKAQYDAIRAADAKASDNADLKAEDVTVDKGAADTDITAKLPKTQQVTLANGYGTAKRDVTWDVSNVDTSKPGEYTVTGTVDTIGANENHWKWTNAAGESKTDEDDLINSGANANNSWKQTGGFVDNETANKNRTLYSSTAITVTAKVTVTGETEPTDPDLLADFTFDDGDKTFDGGNATGTTQGTATLADGKDGKAAKSPMTAPRGSAPKTKEQKRAEAEARNRAYAALKNQRKRVKELDKIIERETARMDEIMALLADPEFYTNEDSSSDVIAEHAKLKQSLSAHEEEWIMLSEEIEEEMNKGRDA